MIEISNLRKICNGEQTILKSDIKSDIEREDREESIWISVENQYSYMMNDKTSKDNYDFCKQNGMKMPSVKLIKFAKFCKRVIYAPLKIMR